MWFLSDRGSMALAILIVVVVGMAGVAFVRAMLDLREERRAKERARQLLTPPPAPRGDPPPPPALRE